MSIVLKASTALQACSGDVCPRHTSLGADVHRAQASTVLRAEVEPTSIALEASMALRACGGDVCHKTHLL